MSCWMYVGCTLDVRWMMLDVSCQYDRSQNVGKVVFCNCWACCQNPCYGMCFFLLRFCINNCDDLAVKLACQGGPPLGPPAEACFSSVVTYCHDGLWFNHCCCCCIVVVKSCSGSWPARLLCISCAKYLGCRMPRILCACWSPDHSTQTTQAKALTSPEHTSYISKG